MTGAAYARPSFPMPEREYDGKVRRPSEMGQACARVLKRGYSHEYNEAHLVARWCLGMFHDPPVACRDCGATDWERRLHAALDWEAAPAERLRIDRTGKIFSIRPDLDYIPLCVPCHKRHDTWRKALPAIAAA